MNSMSRVTSWRGTQKCALRIFRSSAYASSWCQDVAAPLKGRLVDGVIEAMLDGAPEQALGDRRAAGERQSVRELRLEVAAVEALPRMASRCGRSFSGCGRACRLTTGVHTARKRRHAAGSESSALADFRQHLPEDPIELVVVLESLPDDRGQVRQVVEVDDDVHRAREGDHVVERLELAAEEDDEHVPPHADGHRVEHLQDGV